MITGIVLAAGAGRRYGQPKALVSDERGHWLVRSAVALVDGGCDGVVVVLGAAVVGPTELLRDSGLAEVTVVVAEDWATGMSASLRAGLSAVEDVRAAVITLVDLPDVDAPVVARVLGPPVSASTLRRASYAGAPGHPVVIGRDHFAGVLAACHDDLAALPYLRTRRVDLVECADLASGVDRDVPNRAPTDPELPSPHARR